MSTDVTAMAVCSALVALDIAVATRRSRVEKRSRRRRLIVDAAVEQRLRDLTTVTVETMLGAAAYEDARYDPELVPWSPQVSNGDTTVETFHPM